MKTHNIKKMPRIYTIDALEIVTISYGGVLPAINRRYTVLSPLFYVFLEWEMEKSFIEGRGGDT